MQQQAPTPPITAGAPQPQGLESILQALALGGQPTGNIANAGTSPLDGAQAPDISQANPELLMLLQQALASGAFNGQNQLPIG